jgi:uncharacterized membrane protein YkoI
MNRKLKNLVMLALLLVGLISLVGIAQPAHAQIQTQAQENDDEEDDTDEKDDANEEDGNENGEEDNEEDEEASEGAEASSEGKAIEGFGQIAMQEAIQLAQQSLHTETAPFEVTLEKVQGQLAWMLDFSNPARQVTLDANSGALLSARNLSNMPSAEAALSSYGKLSMAEAVQLAQTAYGEAAPITEIALEKDGEVLTYRLDIGDELVVLNADTGEVLSATAEAYEPVIDPANFVAVIDNPFFPLKPGTTFVYEGQTDEGLEHIEDFVTFETKTVMGVSCVVLKNTATIDGELVEETFDWYAQDKAGNVWYFGESVKNYEGGILVDTDGSWEAGVDGALPGIIMQAKPQVGDVYRQEYYQGAAEDMAEILSTTEAARVPYGSFSNVLVTKDWTPLEPGLTEHKYYAKGVGLILEENIAGNSGTIELIEIRSE